MKATSAEIGLAMERVEAALADLEMAYLEYWEFIRQYQERNIKPQSSEETA